MPHTKNTQEVQYVDPKTVKMKMKGSNKPAIATESLNVDHVMENVNPMKWHKDITSLTTIISLVTILTSKKKARTFSHIW